MQMLMVLLRRLVSTFFFFHCRLWTLLFCSICDSTFISFFLLLSVLTSLLIDFKLLNYHFSILLQVFRWFAFIRRRLISLLKKGYFLKVTADQFRMRPKIFTVHVFIISIVCILMLLLFQVFICLLIKTCLLFDFQYLFIDEFINLVIVQVICKLKLIDETLLFIVLNNYILLKGFI